VKRYGAGHVGLTEDDDILSAARVAVCMKTPGGRGNLSEQTFLELMDVFAGWSMGKFKGLVLREDC